MSAHANPDIVDDGLVFMYDTDDGKSYKGEPTENIFLNPTFIGTAGTQTSTVTDNWYFSGYTGDSGFKFYNNSTSPFSLKFPNEGSLITTGANDDSTTQNRRFYCDEVLQAGATYTVSAWIYTTRTSGLSIAHFEYGGSSLNSGYFSGTSTHPNHVLGEWYYWEDTYTVGADYTSGLIGPVHTGSSDTIVGIQRFQIEKKSHATPFVNGTRSATQGLLDRTSISTINISNASFDSNAQMTFDGTDDYIEVPNTNLPAPSTNLTMECVFQRDSGRTIINYGPSGFNTSKNYGFECLGSNPALRSNINTSSGSTQIIGTTVINSNTKYYGAMTYDGSSVKLYVNGKLEASASKSGSILNSSTPSLNIGRKNSGNGEYINGEIPIVRIYNRALTAAEVLQNYNAIKSRFQ
jgi:hypothetical protein